jgi:hypothetical protein
LYIYLCISIGFCYLRAFKRSLSTGYTFSSVSSSITGLSPKANRFPSFNVPIPYYVKDKIKSSSLPKKLVKKEKKSGIFFVPPKYSSNYSINEKGNSTDNTNNNNNYNYNSNNNTNNDNYNNDHNNNNYYYNNDNNNNNNINNTNSNNFNNNNSNSNSNGNIFSLTQSNFDSCTENENYSFPSLASDYSPLQSDYLRSSEFLGSSMFRSSDFCSLDRRLIYSSSRFIRDPSLYLDSKYFLENSNILNTSLNKKESENKGTSISDTTPSSKPFSRGRPTPSQQRRVGEK